MKKLFFLITTALLCLPFSGVESNAQQNISKIEVGAQFSSLSLSQPGVKREVGAGGRVTYNLTDEISFEAEGNFFPSGSTRGFTPGGNILQAQFGIKAGKRWEKFGVFAKARPGLVSFDGTFTPIVRQQQIPGGSQIPIIGFEVGRSTHFSTDIGGVLAVYPSRRVIVRFDAGDTIIRYGPRDAIDFTLPPPNPIIQRSRVELTHNFQFSAGVGFRLFGPKDESGSTEMGGRDVPSRNSSTQRFEAGAHFTSLTFNPPRPFSGSPVIFGENRPLTETGLGGRFIFNLLDCVGLESEINYFPTSDTLATALAGRILQGQFGVKAGKRFRAFGVFGKVRPGFVSFSRATLLVGTKQITVFGRPVDMGIFEVGRRTLFSTDFGGVFEFYPSKRLAIRVDVGDTVIRYGVRSEPGFSASQLIVTSPAETRHNFQFSSGFTLRF